MKNVEIKVDEKSQKLTIVVDLKQRHGLSSSQKTVTIASTEGNQKIGVGDIAFGLNVYTKDGLAKMVAEAGKATADAG